MFQIKYPQGVLETKVKHIAGPTVGRSTLESLSHQLSHMASIRGEEGSSTFLGWFERAPMIDVLLATKCYSIVAEGEVMLFASPKPHVVFGFTRLTPVTAAAAEALKVKRLPLTFLDMGLDKALFGHLDQMPSIYKVKSKMTTGV